jgi:hypothetical protein
MAGMFVTALIGAVAGGLPDAPTLRPEPMHDPRDTVISAFYGRKGGKARLRRAVGLVLKHRGTDDTSGTRGHVLEHARRSNAYDQRRNRTKRKPLMRTSTGLLAFPR